MAVSRRLGPAAVRYAAAVGAVVVLAASGIWLLVGGAGQRSAPATPQVASGPELSTSAAPPTRVQAQQQLRRQQARPPQTRPPAGRKGVPDEIAGPVLRESEPVAVSIPRLGVRSPLVQLRVDSSGAMEVPADPAEAGWYALGPAPGALGPAVIAGHVTWNGSPGVFSGLARLRAGDRVAVAREDGRTAFFEVTRVAQFHKSAFPARLVFGSVDYAGLRLITCGGDYDAEAHHYADNVVAFARLVGSGPPGR